MMSSTIALIAHDSQKDQIVNFAIAHTPVLARYRLIATGTTGQRIQDATGLPVEKMLSGPTGGDAQVAAEIARGQVAAVFFLVDPLYAQPHEPNLQMFLRICNVHNVALATNLSTAEAIVQQLANKLVAHLIFNPVAGQGSAEQDLDLIRQLLTPHMALHIHETAAETNPKELVEEALSQGADVVIASGGDGTISAVAGALIGTGVPLGIIPRGTANAFAVALGIPRVLPVRTACQVILAGQTRQVDAARCNGLPMILLAGIGYEAEMVDLASREMKDQWGMMAYLMAGWQMLDEQDQFQAEIEAEGEVYELQASAITVANAAPPTSVLAQGGGEVIYDDGLLDVTIAAAETKVQAVTTMLRMLGAALVKAGGAQQQNVVHGRAKTIKITTDPPQKVVVDGEIIGTTPIKVECIPGGLTVLAPSTGNSVA
ncbi:MAG: methylglyoxal synthase [Leptolyngbyaceae cyanobacterium bins.349]|nr:methylglyoxal synthase [Leptolyngbyaceae cyanobacterium bins.349]